MKDSAGQIHLLELLLTFQGLGRVYIYEVTLNVRLVCLGYNYLKNVAPWSTVTN